MANRLVEFFLGSKKKPEISAAKVVAVEKSAKEKFNEVFKHYDLAYGMSRRSIGVGDTSETRKNFLYKLYLKLPNFSHTDLVTYVLNSPEEIHNIIKNFEIMEKCLKQPTPMNLDNFATAGDAVRVIVDNNLAIANEVSMFLLQNDAFCKALEEANNTDSPVNMFRWYYDLSKAAKVYYDDMYALSNTMAWGKQMEKKEKQSSSKHLGAA